MTFLAPVFFAALLAVSIPVIIHLLNLKKPKEVRFSTLAFFSILQKSTIRRLMIKRWLLLAVRVAAIASLALVLTRPFVTSSARITSDNDPVLYGILIDNSPGMQRIDSNGPFFEQIQEIVTEIIQRAGSNDRFLIYNSHGVLSQSSFVNATSAIALLNRMQPQNKSDQMFQRLTQIQMILDDEPIPNKVVYWITDGRRKRMESTAAINFNNSNTSVQMIRIGNQASLNTAVSGFKVMESMSGTGRPVIIEAQVINFGDDLISNHFVTAEVNGVSVGQYQADIRGGETQSYMFEFPAEGNEISGRIILEGDAYSTDNTWYFSIQIPDEKSVLLIRPESQRYIESVLQSGSTLTTTINLEITDPERAFLVDMMQFDAIVLDGINNISDLLRESVARSVQNGAGIVFYPSSSGDLESYNRFFNELNTGRFSGMRGSYGSFEPTSVLGRLIEGHPVLDEIFDKPENDPVRIDLPRFYYYLRYSNPTASPGQPVLNTAINEPLLVEHRFGNGRVLIHTFGSDPGWSNLPAHPFFAPLVFRTVLYASQAGQLKTMSHTLGRSFESSVPLNNLQVEITIDNDVYRPETSLRSNGELLIRYPAVEWSPGIYQISDGSEQISLAVNQHIMESDFQTLYESELRDLLDGQIRLAGIFEKGEETLSDFRNRIVTSGIGQEIWHWFLWIGFLLLIIESLISRYFKAETTG